MKKILVASIALLMVAACSSAFAQGQAVYDPATGNVVIEGIDGIGGIQFRSDENAGTDTLNGGEADNNGGFVTPTSEQQLDWLFFDPGGKSSPINLGNVAPTGLFQDRLDNNYFLGVVITGSGVSDPRANPVPIVGGNIIPEPTTVLLAGMGLVGLMAGRRRS